MVINNFILGLIQIIPIYCINDLTSNYTEFQFDARPLSSPPPRHHCFCLPPASSALFDDEFVPAIRASARSWRT